MGKNTFSTHLAEYLTEYTDTEDISSHFGSAFAVLGIGGLLGSVLLIMEIAYNCIFDTMEK